MDLYTGLWPDQRFFPKDYVLSADEKTSIQSRMLLSDAATGIGSTDPDRARVPLRWGVAVIGRMVREPGVCDGPL